MARNADRRSAGRSTIAPYVDGETSKRRHERRLMLNAGASKAVFAECTRLGIALSIKNDNQHWVFTVPGSRAEWWPSSAKLVFDALWGDGIHVHDYEQALRIIARRWGLPKPKE